ncbi:MAG: hypothetical protein AAFU67_08350, partial [Bacteroidota bacterium]
RQSPGNYDCEAVIYFHNHLHLFTKAIPGRRKQYWSYHFRLPADPGEYVAELVDSFYFARRTITGASFDRARKELVLISYNYKKWLGIFPVVASSLMQLTGFPEDRFFQGKLMRRNVSWGLPVQYEAIAYFDDRYLYIVTEKTRFRRSAFMKRKRRFKH